MRRWLNRLQNVWRFVNTSERSASRAHQLQFVYSVYTLCVQSYQFGDDDEEDGS